MYSRKNVYVCIVLVLCCAVEANQVLLVSMDGFRWDYLKKTSLPNFERLADYGTKTEYINNTFVTKTFPSHYSIVTGMYQVFFYVIPYIQATAGPVETSNRYGL